ncbi:MAG: hypothetical protein Q9167_003468 [Letrouitia subvulpina]
MTDVVSTLLTILALFIPRYLAQQDPSGTFNDPLLATSLFGSHFGIPGIPSSYDYLVVGGGTAGLTLARRLAEDSSVTVAVIEAGGFYEMNNGNFSQIPAFATYWVDSGPPRNPLVDWYQQTEPQAGFGGRSVHYPAGKTLGGGSARNLLWYQRGSKGSYKKWADQVGDASFEYEALLPYFEKSVQFIPPSKDRPANSTPKYDPATTATSGLLQIGYPTWVNGISSWIAQSLNSLGVRELPGLISGELLGWSYITETIASATQTRSSSESSYLRDALQKTTNLQIYSSTLAKKVIFDDSKRANGVTVNSGGFEYQISARKEVIVSAGAFRSPQLLLVSGIGPKETLDQLTIPVLADRPGVGFEKLSKNATSSGTRADLDATFGADWPDIELLFFDGDLVGAPPDTRNYVSSLAGIVAPFSRGNVTINSTDTTFNPIISPNWLQDPRDQEVAIAGFKRARQIFQTASMRPVILGGREVFPGANVTSDQDILNVIRKSASSIDHAAGTCKMGKVGDVDAVVDSRARVIGVEGLRVVDASAFPFLPPGHPQGTVCKCASGEDCRRYIKGRWRDWGEKEAEKMNKKK